MKWSSVGVAWLYQALPLEFYLLDGKGAIAARVRAAADLRSWLPCNHECTEQFAVPEGLKPGRYALGLALVDSEGHPAVKLAIDAPETGRLYRVGSMIVKRDR